MVGVVHTAWGLGSAWPMRTREELAEAVVGNDTVPGAGACFAVAGATMGAAALVAGAGGSGRVARLGRWGVAAVLATRGVLGGRATTAALGLPAPSDRFVRLNARVYQPLCLALALASAVSAAEGD